MIRRARGGDKHVTRTTVATTGAAVECDTLDLNLIDRQEMMDYDAYFAPPGSTTASTAPCVPEITDLEGYLTPYGLAGGMPGSAATSIAPYFPAPQPRVQAGTATKRSMCPASVFSGACPERLRFTTKGEDHPSPAACEAENFKPDSWYTVRDVSGVEELCQFVELLYAKCHDEKWSLTAGWPQEKVYTTPFFRLLLHVVSNRPEFDGLGIKERCVRVVQFLVDNGFAVVQPDYPEDSVPVEQLAIEQEKLIEGLLLSSNCSTVAKRRAGRSCFAVFTDHTRCRAVAMYQARELTKGGRRFEWCRIITNGTKSCLGPSRARKKPRVESGEKKTTVSNIDKGLQAARRRRIYKTRKSGGVTKSGQPPMFLGSPPESFAPLAMEPLTMDLLFASGELVGDSSGGGSGGSEGGGSGGEPSMEWDSSRYTTAIPPDATCIPPDAMHIVPAPAAVSAPTSAVAGVADVTVVTGDTGFVALDDAVGGLETIPGGGTSALYGLYNAEVFDAATVSDASLVLDVIPGPFCTHGPIPEKHQRLGSPKHHTNGTWRRCDVLRLEPRDNNADRNHHG